MKRSEMIEVIREVLRANHPITDSNGDLYVSSEILSTLESSGMFYTPVEDLGDFGKLRTPKGWEDEEV